MARHFRGRAPRGMTLIELLIVVAILVILVTAATATMQVGAGGRDIREAARQVNAVLGGGLARAAETGRPAGVWIERAANDANAAYEVFFAEVPPVYAGDTITARAMLPDGNGTLAIMTSIDATLVQVGDLIRFNYQGPMYPITLVNAGSISFSSVGKPKPPAYLIGTGVPFQIFRQPRKSSLNPLQMPNGTMIDLANSGTGTTTEFSGAAGPIVVLFAPNGSVDGYYYNNTRYNLVGNIHFLVGRVGQTGAVNLGTEPNEMRWVSVNHQSGTVITTENLSMSADHNGDGSINMGDARKYANAGSSMGGG